MDRSQRIRKVLCIAGVLAAILGGYYLCLHFNSPFKIPCMFYEITGLQCPGCGVSRMLIAISHGEFARAFSYNQVLFVLLPVLAADLFWCIYLYIRYGRVKSRIHSAGAWVILVILLIFGIVRNIF